MKTQQVINHTQEGHKWEKNETDMPSKIVKGATRTGMSCSVFFPKVVETVEDGGISYDGKRILITDVKAEWEE
jgi:hypothetical protein